MKDGVYTYRKFCSQSCSASYNNKMKPKRKLTGICDRCSKPAYAKAKYCQTCNSNDFSRAKRDHFLEQWLEGRISGGSKYKISTYVRSYLLEKSNNSCSKCGWNQINPTTQKVPLEVNHIDGKGHNHSPDNVEILCPNCHSLTPNYKALNKGNGRDWVYVRKTKD